ncbi:MAG TPA: peptidoglycan DD-metalloendopeptidase family protein [Thermoleophilaceae bacterium]|nr:peptidoglycan DD-metalloendopeptidase family protein [Thermoleophilaceae bacterium]
MPHAAVRTVALAVFSLLCGGVAADASETGGAVMPEAPRVETVRCVSSGDLACASRRTAVRGGTVRIAGSGLRHSKKVVFMGRRTRSDDVATRPRHRSAGHLEADVPSRARSGPIRIVDKLGRQTTTKQAVRVVVAPPIDVAPGAGYYFGGQRKPTFRFTARRAGPVQVEVVHQGDESLLTSILATVSAGHNSVTWDGLVRGQPAPSGAYSFRLAGAAGQAAGSDQPFALFDHLFPIRGKHNLGYTKTNQFGGARGHQGTDMFAACGTRLAAARGGRVQYAGYHSRAGNYVVIDGSGTGNDYAYMHMRRPSLVSTGQQVFTGQKLGEVGETGRASGCHLHFELWTAPGWYEGGRPFDALPSLKVWDSYG